MSKPRGKTTPKKIQARWMGKIMALSDRAAIDDKELGELARRFAACARQEVAAWRASLDANGHPL